MPCPRWNPKEGWGESSSPPPKNHSECMFSPILKGPCSKGKVYRFPKHDFSGDMLVFFWGGNFRYFLEIGEILQHELTGAIHPD